MISTFLQRGRIARNAERCICYSRFVCLSICHMVVFLSRSVKIRSCGFQHQVVQWI